MDAMFKCGWTLLIVCHSGNIDSATRDRRVFRDLENRNGKATIVFKRVCFKVVITTEEGSCVQLIDWKKWEDGETLSQCYRCYRLANEV